MSSSAPRGERARPAGDVAAILRLIREKQARLRQLEQAAHELGQELDAVRASVGGQPTPQRKTPLPVKEQRRPVWPSSIAGRAVAALRRVGRPLRVEPLLQAVQRGTRKKITPATLVGQLARDTRKGRLFRRTAPNEYALAEWTLGRWGS